MQDSEGDLLMRAAAGERDAFDVFVGTTSPSVWRLVRRLTADAETAEEVLQETYVAAWRGLAGFRQTSSARSWLLGIARKQAARTWRRRAGQPTFAEPLDAELGLAAGWGSDPELAASRAEDRQRLLAALSTLPEADQEVITRCDLEGSTAVEFGAENGLSPNASRVRLHRARLRLMAALRGGQHE
ncbi:MAG: sigma-70 family RNA polymerase sigma factor [Proteobacteria bacterium]|nr:sigma-70 family RNA polymerase sigma factor [Pseudomonadota bacterium]